MEHHGLVAVLAAIGGALISLVYLRSVIQGRTKPHVLTWSVWGLLCALGAAVMYLEGAKAGSLVLGASAATNFSTALLGIWKGDKHITKGDMIAFVAALSIVPIWLLTHEALIAAVLVTAINMCGSFPTYRKSWVLPFDENRNVFACYTVTSFLGVMAITPFTLTTALYPVVIFLSNAALAVLITFRRKVCTLAI